MLCSGICLAGIIYMGSVGAIVGYPLNEKHIQKKKPKNGGRAGSGSGCLSLNDRFDELARDGLKPFPMPLPFP